LQLIEIYLCKSDCKSQHFAKLPPFPLHCTHPQQKGSAYSYVTSHKLLWPPLLFLASGHWALVWGQKKASRKDQIPITKVTIKPLQHVPCINRNRKINLQFAWRSLPADRAQKAQFLCSFASTETLDCCVCPYAWSLSALDSTLPPLKKYCTHKFKYILIYEFV
jgi:hypothetical protein